VEDGDPERRSTAQPFLPTRRRRSEGRGARARPPLPQPPPLLSRSCPVEQGATQRRRTTATGAHEEARGGGWTGVRSALVVARATSLRLVCTRDVELLRRVAALIRRARGRLPPAPGEAARPSLPASMEAGCCSASSISSSSGSAGARWGAGRGEAVLDWALGGGGHGSVAPSLAPMGPSMAFPYLLSGDSTTLPCSSSRRRPRALSSKVQPGSGQTRELLDCDDRTFRGQARAREELGAWARRGWRRSAMPSDMASMRVDGKMKEGLSSPAAARKTGTPSWRMLLKDPVQMVSVAAATSTLAVGRRRAEQLLSPGRLPC
jgi:hypothetical protein